VVTWARLDPRVSRHEWTALLREAGDANPFQAYGWGEYKRAFGWVPERWVARRPDCTPICCLQVLKKRWAFGRVMAWVPGGPLFGFSGVRAAAVGDLLAGWLQEFRRENRLAYARFYSLHRHSAEAAYGLRQVCPRPLAPINTGFTLVIDVSLPLEQLRSGMTAKHRYYVKQAEAAGLDWKFGNTDELVQSTAQLHDEMTRAKGLPRLRCDFATLQALDRGFGDAAVFFVGYWDGHPVTSCLVLTEGETAFYLLAATNAAGRQMSAAYAMVFRLFEVLKSRGITHFDFGGLAPGSSAAGVDHFKRGFGGEVVEYLGEWEVATPAWLRWPSNALIKWTNRL
jgi:lipid II:glycine glycyltransferase (peptidoglycan interpeptide bridge formation enzyme)